VTKRCLKEPIPEIFDAAQALDAAASAHLRGEAETAGNLIRQANNPVIRRWTESIWGKRDPMIHVFIVQSNPLPHLLLSERPQPRMPGAAAREEIIGRDGFHCRFCGIPVIPVEIRQFLNRHYPGAATWGRGNVDQHAALQCMWLQFDHLIPNERGGASEIDNVIVTCAPCNFGRMQFTIEEAGLDNPLLRPLEPTWVGYERWDGLTRLLAASHRLRRPPA
jgi:hypothetical protein